MRKGEMTRQTILEHAMGLSSTLGLEGLTIGKLAEDLELSKSGLYAHFRSKEALQIQVLQHAASCFADTVIEPALAAPPGEPRVRAIFDRWLNWPETNPLPGGCIFVQAASELDDRPGPVRDLLARLQRDWLEVVSSTVRTAIAEGHFVPDVDPEQFAQDLYGVLLACHHGTRLLRDPKAIPRARHAFEALLLAARTPRAPSS